MCPFWSHVAITSHVSTHNYHGERQRFTMGGHSQNIKGLTCVHGSSPTSYANHHAGFLHFTHKTRTHTHTDNKKKKIKECTGWCNCLDDAAMFVGGKNEKNNKKKTSQSEEIKQIHITERVSGDLVYLGSRWLLWSNIYKSGDGFQATSGTWGMWCNDIDLLKPRHMCHRLNLPWNNCSLRLLSFANLCEMLHYPPRVNRKDFESVL